MSRFIYLADTHIGTDLPAYFKQPPHPGRVMEIFAALRDWIAEHGEIDFILHGGDMAHFGDETSVRRAAQLLRSMPVPVYCCLGNHDLTEPESLQRWLTLLPEAFPGASPEYTIRTADCAIHVVPNHWRPDAPYFWIPEEETVTWYPEQWEALEARYQPRTGEVQIIATHSPVFGLPPGQTGLQEPLHPGPESFRNQLTEWIAGRSEVAAVLGAHSHMNMRLEHRGVHYVTASSFSESPFEFKLFEAAPGCLRMETIALGDRVGFEGGYDTGLAFVQGRAEDRAFTATLPRRV